MTHSGGKPHNVGDKGQRFEVSYFDSYTNTRKVFGWSDTIDGAQRFANCIEASPSMEFPQILDRFAKRQSKNETCCDCPECIEKELLTPAAPTGKSE